MPRKNDNPQFPVSGVKKYKFDKDLDAQVRSKQEVIYGLGGEGPLVMPGHFKARRDAQIKARKKMGY